MSRYSFYIDGFNVYYALQKGYRQYKWLDYMRLAQAVIRSGDTIDGVYYFTTFATWKQENVKRHKEYIRALRSVGVEVVMGRFMVKEATCHICKGRYRTHEEKRTDVNIALRVTTDAIFDQYDRALIISADSDLLPVINTVHKHASDKEIGVMFPIGRSSLDLRQNADFRLKMSPKLLRRSQFPDELTIGNMKAVRPETWK